MKGSEVEKEVCAYAESLGCMSIKFKDLSRAGGPDRLFISKGGNVRFMEFKGPGEAMSARQLDYMRDLYGHGALGYIVSDTRSGVALINSLLRKDAMEECRRMKDAKKI